MTGGAASDAVGDANTPPGRPVMRPWRFVVAFGMVSLLADFVYEGARSVVGPLLGSLGASAAVVGVVTGAGDASALILRLVSGPLAARGRRYWAWTVAGYLLTVVSVPPLGVVGTLWAACVLVVAERVGKAVRSPAKDTLLSHATAAVGRGRGFAVHEALDQTGALIGPLIVAGMLAATGGRYGPALLVLAAPGVGMLALLLWLRARVPNPADAYEPEKPEKPETHETPETPEGPRPGPGPRGDGDGAWRLPRPFWLYCAFVAATTSGYATFGVLSFHLVHRHVLPLVAVPLVYAGAMFVDALAALATGWAYDRTGSRVLVVLPVLTAAVPALAFTRTPTLAVGGVLLWGAAMGVQDSTLRAVVADMIPAARRATAYGVFAGVIGVGTLIGGTLTGALYTYSVPVLIVTVIAIQAAALALLAVTRLSRTLAKR